MTNKTKLMALTKLVFRWAGNSINERSKQGFDPLIQLIRESSSIINLINYLQFFCFFSREDKWSLTWIQLPSFELERLSFSTSWYSFSLRKNLIYFENNIYVTEKGVCHCPFRSTHRTLHKLPVRTRNYTKHHRYSLRTINLPLTFEKVHRNKKFGKWHSKTSKAFITS